VCEEERFCLAKGKGGGSCEYVYCGEPITFESDSDREDSGAGGPTKGILSNREGETPDMARRKTFFIDTAE